MFPIKASSAFIAIIIVVIAVSLFVIRTDVSLLSSYQGSPVTDPGSESTSHETQVHSLPDPAQYQPNDDESENVSQQAEKVTQIISEEANAPKSSRECTIYVYDVLPLWDRYGTWVPKYGASQKPDRDITELYKDNWIPERRGFLEVMAKDRYTKRRDSNAENVVFDVIHNRILKDPRRVMDPTKATILFIPLTQSEGQVNYTQMASALRKENPSFDLPGSHQRHFWYTAFPIRDTLDSENKVGWPGSPRLFDGWQKHVTRLSLEILVEFAPVAHQFQTIPYLSMFAGFPGMKPSDYPNTWPREQPELLALGSFGQHGRRGRRIRTTLTKICEEAEDCEITKLDLGATWYGMDARNGSVKYDPNESIDSHRRAVFSLQPSGDTYTRKAVFDALALGCIPVFFSPMSFYYPWFGAEDADKISILIPESQTEKTLEILRSIPKQQIQKMQQSIAQLGMRYNYVHDREWCNPDDGCVDAYETIYKNMCKRAGPLE